jgi:hypothetical protein
MAQPLNQQMTGSIFGGIAVIGVLGLGAYMYLVLAKPAEVTPPASLYSTAVITTELQAKDGVNVFLKTGPLQSVVQGQTGQVDYQQSELGKQDLTQIGK